jgi:hypothetical protein
MSRVWASPIEALHPQSGGAWHVELLEVDRKLKVRGSAELPSGGAVEILVDDGEDGVLVRVSATRGSLASEAAQAARALLAAIADARPLVVERREPAPRRQDRRRGCC